MITQRPNHRAKLTAEQVREIRRILAEEPVSYATLAERYGVSEPTISHIANFQTWRHLLEPAPPDRAPEPVGTRTDAFPTNR